MNNKHGFPLFSNRMKMATLVVVFFVGLYVWDTWVAQTCYDCYEAYR